MKRVIMTICGAAFLFAACSDEKKTDDQLKGNATEPTANESKPKEKPAWIPVDSAAGMKAMMDAGTPGESHKLLAKGTGTWTAEMTHWMGDGKPAEKFTGKSVTTMIYGGRYQQSKFSGDMMGMPFEGSSLMGYDNTEKKYFSTWIDNWSTGMMTAWGTWDEANKSFNLSATMKNPANGLDCDIRETYKIVDDNNHVMEMYGPDPTTGKEYKMMEIKYTKKK